MAKCENCDKEYNEVELSSQGEYGLWCEECLDKTPGDTTGYCSAGCCLGYGCDESC